METNYYRLNNKQLQKLCMERKIKYYNRMNKHQMIEILLKNEKEPNYVVDEDIKKKSFNYHKNWITKNHEKYNENQKKYQRKYWLRKFIDEGLIDKKLVNEEI